MPALRPGALATAGTLGHRAEVDRLGWQAFVAGAQDQEASAGARLARITLFPIKSLDGVTVDQAVVLPSGALKHDRQFALLDERGEFVNAKRTPAIHRLSAALDPNNRVLNVRTRGDAAWRTFRVDADRTALERWLSKFFTMAVRLVEDAAHGFPDDRDAAGPTVVSTATVQEVAAWFPGLAPDDVRRRFRANLEIDGVEPFWEDRLYGEPGQGVAFQLGELRLEGVNPCRRCVVPSRSPDDGVVTAEFAKIFAQRRQETLPPWAARSRFDHFYRLAVNTRRNAPAEETVIRVGDELRVLSPEPV